MGGSNLVRASRPLVAAVLGTLAAVPATAQLTTEAACMQDLAGFALNCNANDVQVASATDIQILDDGCAYPGDMVTFAATFEVVLTAQERHDVGLYFAVDGDMDGDGAVTGSCSVSTLAIAPDPPSLDLDGTEDGGFCQNDASLACTSDRDCRPVGGACGFTQDLCGDVDSAHSPLFPVIEITTACIDPDGNGKLNLPNCTSWRQPGANELCLDPSDAFPGAPSKCRCDLGFEVDIDVPPARLAVVKTATPTHVDEPGGRVTFDVRVTNDSPFAMLDLASLVDDVYGDVTQVQGSILSTTCALPRILEHGQSYACAFDATVAGPGGSTHTDVVTATGMDENGNVVHGSDDASVAITDLLPSLSLVKDASPTQVLEPGDDVTFDVTVRNTSTADTVTIGTLSDSVFGNLDGRGTCAVPQTLAPGGSYACAFTAFVGGAPGYLETDVVTAWGSDDEGNTVSASDSASVNVSDVPSTIEVTKVASPTSLDEPGGLVTFSFTVTNLSGVDSITVDALTDTVLGNLDGRGDCAVPQTLPPSGVYACTVTANVPGNAFDVETNVVTASGADDDGNPVSDDDTATVNVRDVAPAATLGKRVSAVLATFEVTVRNGSSAEPLSLDSLVDDVFGDVTVAAGDIVRTDCAVPRTLAVKGQPGDAYTCTFDADVTASPHVDTVTATVSDDEGNRVEPSDSATLEFD